MPPAIGATDLPDLKKRDFIDRSDFIKMVIDGNFKVLLITRPRRFMKTSNLRTLLFFFRKTVMNKPTAGLFDDMKISNTLGQNGKSYVELHQGQYPTIWITFNEVTGTTVDEIYESFKYCISCLYQDYLAPHAEMLDVNQKTHMNNIINRTGNIPDFYNSIHWLTQMLYKVSNNVKVIVLIDEYDKPLTEYYQTNQLADDKDKVINMIKKFLHPALKDNHFLEKALITGIIKLSPADIFSGINNLIASTMLDPIGYQAFFGFTEEEVNVLYQKAIPYDDITGEVKFNLEDLKVWYNGYTIGDRTLYNPWSIVNCLQEKKLDGFWTLTGSTAMLAEMVDYGYMRELLNGRVVAELNDDLSIINFRDRNDFYELLNFSGYVRAVAINSGSNDIHHLYELQLVNKEITHYFVTSVLKFLSLKYKFSTDGWILCASLLADKPPKISEFIKCIEKYIIQPFISFRDAKQDSHTAVGDEKVYENFYQGLMLGFFIYMSNLYAVSSNRESGMGYADFILKPKNDKQTRHAFIVELKQAREESKMIGQCQQGIIQIKDRQYSTELRKEGYQLIKGISICFWGKKVRGEEIDL